MADVKHNILISYLLNTGGSEKKIDGLASKMSSLSTIASRAQGLAVGFLGGRALAKSFIGYNMEIENSVTALATTMFGFGKAKTFNEGMEASTRLVAEYREVAKKSLGESSDFIDMHQTLQGTLLSQGVAYEALKDITVGATVASQLFGEEAGMTALDIKQMAMGTMTAKDRVGGLLVGMVAASKGWKNFGYEQFNKLDPAKRIELLQEAVNSPALKEAADQMSKSFAGQWSTAMDNVKQILGDVGLPIFKSITEELTKAGVWIDKNKDKVKEWTDAVGGGLKDAFSILATTFKFIADNAKALIAVAAAYAAVRVGSGLNNVLGGAQKALSGAAISAGTSFGSSAATAGTKLMGAANAASGLIAAGTAGYALGTALLEVTGGAKAWADVMEDFTGGNKINKSITAIDNWTNALDASTAASKRTGLAGSKEGLAATYKREAALARATLNSSTGGDSAKFHEAQKAAMAMDISSKVLLGNQATVDFANQRDAMAAKLMVDAFRLGLQDTLGIKETPLGAKEESAGKGTNVNVTISRIEVQNDDPNRYAFSLNEAFRKIGKNPSSARRSLGSAR